MLEVTGFRCECRAAIDCTYPKCKEGVEMTTEREDMHIAPMADSQGEFAEFKVQPKIPCRKCGVHAVSMREWESSCGGYEDYQYRCNSCGHSWWVDGIDA